MKSKKEFSIPVTLGESIDAIDLEIDFKGEVVERIKNVSFGWFIKCSCRKKKILLISLMAALIE